MVKKQQIIKQYINILLDLVDELNNKIKHCDGDRCCRSINLENLKKTTKQIDGTIDLIYGCEEGHEFGFDEYLNKTLGDLLKDRNGENNQ